MRKRTTSLSMLLALAPVLLGASASSVAQEKTLTESFAASRVGDRKVFVHNSRITFSRVTWYFFAGTPISCSFKIEQSDFGADGTWSDLIPPQDCSSEGKFEFVTPVINKALRINLISLTGLGTGVVHIFWEGFIGTGCGFQYSGALSTVIGPDPAAGTELSTVVPAHERWRVRSVMFKLQTNNAVIDREVFLSVFDENENEYFRTFADGVVKANQTGMFTTANLGFVGTTGLGPSSINQPADERTVMIPVPNAFIPGGHTLTTDTSGLQTGPTGDDYGPAIASLEICPN